MTSPTATPARLTAGIAAAALGAIAMIAWGALNLSRTTNSPAPSPVQPAYNMTPKASLVVAAVDVPAGAAAVNNP